MATKKWEVKVIDSLHNVELPHAITAVIYEPAWQGIRLSISWKNEDSLRRTLGIAKAYITAAVTDNEYQCRLYRVRKLLSAVTIYRVGVSVERAEIIQETMEEYTSLIELTDKHIIWDWNDARKQAPHMYNKTHRLFDMMYAELSQRALRGRKTELRYFLAILNEVINVESSS